MVANVEIRAAIEISAQTSPQAQELLAASAYRLSRQGLVVLLLNGIDRSAIDRVMDRVVAQEGVAVVGVRYLDATRGDTAALVLQHVQSVITSTAPLCERLRRAGIPAVLTTGSDSLQRTIAALAA